MSKSGMRWDAAQLREFETRRAGGKAAAPTKAKSKGETESERVLWGTLSPWGFEREFVFHPLRRWRLDFAHVELRIAVEIEGQVHRIESRFVSDLEKYNQAALDGWTLLRFAPAQILDDSAAAIIWQAMTLQRARSARKGDT